MNSGAGSVDRALLAAGTESYRYGDLARLDRVPDALRCVMETLSALGYRPAAPGGAGLPSYLLDPGLQELKDAVRAAAAAAPVVVVYYTGHGMKPGKDLYYLVTAEATQGRLQDGALQAREFVSLALRRDEYDQELPKDEQPQVLVILDCCFSGAGGAEALNESLQGIGSPKVWVLASANSVEYAQQGRFAQALQQALLDPDAGSLEPLLDLNWVAEKINKVLRQAGQEAGWYPPQGRSIGFTPFFPNPKYVPDEAGQLWVSRLRGAPAETATAGFYVTGHTGRLRVAEDLAGWMRDPGRGALAVVTGSPGCGKSAMLALPVLLTDHERRGALIAEAEQGSLLDRAADLFDGLPVLGVHARGLNPYEVAKAIAKHLGRSADSPEELLADLVDDRPEALPRILVINAVDEAREPPKLLTDLLQPLARRAGLRIVIGARRHVLASVGGADLTVDLDIGRYQDPQALAGYAHQLLIAACEPDVATPYRGRHDDTGATVAAAIAEKATKLTTATGKVDGREESFLLAQLLARAVRGRPQVLDVTDDDWARQLPTNIGAAFDEDLRNLLGKREPIAAVEPIAKALLAALAWAKGPGLPRRWIWGPVAQALAARDGTGALDLDRHGVRWLLDNVGAYIVEDLGPGQQSVFRPFHDLIAAHLRGQPSEEQIAADPAAAEAWQQRRQQIESDITRALLDSIPTISDGGPNWEQAHPYLHTYVAQHAHEAGPDTFAELVADLDYLAVADPAILTPLLTPTHPALRWAARPYRRARPLLGDDLRANAAYLQEAVVAQTGSHPASQCIRPTYQTVMAHVRRDDSLLTLTGHTGYPASVAFGTGPDGQLLLASASDTSICNDRTVRLWDPLTGAPVGEPLTRHTDWVDRVPFGTGPDGRLLRATYDDDGTVRVWDLVTGVPVGEPLIGHTGWVRVTFGTGPDGRLLLATVGSDDHTVRVWDPLTGAPVGQPLTHHYSSDPVPFGTSADGRLLLAVSDGTMQVWDPITGAAVSELPLGHAGKVHSAALGTGPDGRLLLATVGSDDHTVRVWDPVTGTPAGEPLTGHTGWVHSVAFGTAPDGRLLLASGSYDRTVRVWDPVTGTPAGELVGHTERVDSVAFGTGPDGRLLLASASYDRTVRVWDPVTGTPAGEPLTGHTDRVLSVALGSAPDGQLLLATADGGDHTVRVWDPVTGTPAGEPLTGHTGWVLSVAFGTAPDGRLLLASASDDRTVRVWDPVTGTQAGKPLTGHADRVTSVAFGTAPDGRLLLAACSHDDTIWLWDPVTGTRVGKPLTGCSVQLPDYRLPLDSDRWGRHVCGTMELLAHRPRFVRSVESVAFGTAPDGRLLLASGSWDETVRVWDPLTGTPAGKPLTGHTETVNSVAFGTGPGGRLLLASASDDRMVRVWDPVAGTQVGELTGHTNDVNSVAFGTWPDGGLLVASGSDDCTVRVWDPITGACTATLQRRSSVNSVAAAGIALAICDNEGVSVIELNRLAA